MRTIIIKSAALTMIASIAIAMMVFAAQPSYVGVRAGRADENYLDSQKCLACHNDHYASWARTYHSRMTQEARDGSVQGDFERDNTFEYLGVKARMEKRAGKFTMTLAFPDGRSNIYPIERTVGSRRIEQYLTNQNGQYQRLPLAYDLINRRWMSLNGSFFHPDSDNYFQHQAQWDANCVFCHNVKAQPRLDPRTKKFETEVSELGIACGACHGQAASHAERATSPLTRMLWRMTGQPDKGIVNPSRLTAERATMVCGHCHGQRIPEPMERIQEILTKGDPYNAGDDLARYYRPVRRETMIGNFSFANRFWANGSPRLTAYEYQGLLRSQCYEQSKGRADHSQQLSCLTCHSMHEGDPQGQIKAENLTDKPCLSCHQQFAPPDALFAHTKHQAGSAGSRCYDCHMPRVVFGVMTFHRTHEISSPDPQLTVAQAVPNACNQCHLDKSVNWAIASVKENWPSRFANAEQSKDEMFNLPEGPRALFAGDALTRAMAAEALSRGPMRSNKKDQDWATPLLIEAFNDNYPIVRFFAAQGLVSGQARLEKPDYLALPALRQNAVEQWWSLYPSMRGQISAFSQNLRARRLNVDIEVGE